MTKLLEQAVASAGTLPDAEQDAIARMMLEEMDSERKWDERFLAGQEGLKRVADKAWAEHEAGGSEPLDVEKL